VVPRSEEIDVRPSAKAHGIQSSRGSGACDDLHNEPNRHAPNRGVGTVYEFVMHSKPKSLRVILACSLENASHAAGQTADLPFCEADSPIILGVPSFDAVRGEIAEDRQERIAVQSELAKFNRSSCASGRHYALESNQFADYGRLEIVERFDHPLTLLRCARY
jgi:hypothetical protein